MSFDQHRRVLQFKRQTRPSAKQLNELVSVNNRQSAIKKPPQQVKNSGKNKPQSVTRQFKIVSIEDDYLVCVGFDGVATTNETFKIAKRPFLRRSLSSHNSVTFTYTDSQTRTANNGGDTETQVIVPPYVADDIVFAKNNIVGGTGVSVTVSGISSPVEWLEENEGRAWAKQAE